MRRTAAAAFLLLLGAAPGCSTSVVVAQPTLERDLAASLEDRRLGAVADRVLSFREGLAREGADLGRLDRQDRAAAARTSMAGLRVDLAAVHRGRLDIEGRADLDIALFLLDQAEEEIRLADGDEERIAGLARPSAEALHLEGAGVPGPETVARLVDPGFMGAPPPADALYGAVRTAADLRAAGNRLRQAAERLRNIGNEVAVLYAEGGGAARKAAQDAAGRMDELAKARDEDAKKYPGGDDSKFAPPCGRERFVAMLRTSHGVDETPESLEAYGLDLLRTTTADLEALAAASFPGLTWRSALEEVRKDHATSAELPAEALRDALAARDFCIERGLVTIPPGARLAHIEMVGDDAARSYPFACYSFRRPTAEGESGRYVVSPGATWMDPAQREQRLQGNCRAWTRVVAPHETWPGHHLQFWVADNDCSRLRRAAGTSVYVEGWGLYCEWLLDHHGYFVKPGERLALLAMRAWRACRVVLDVRLHCGGLTPEQGIDFLVENAGTTRDGATAEVKRYMDSPTQPFSYAVGWREILALRADEERRLGPRFDEREFHDRLLRCGPVPFKFVRRLFGYGEGEAQAAPAGTR
jgi:uncharacterized protein (DUF885 family)